MSKTIKSAQLELSAETIGFEAAFKKANEILSDSETRMAKLQARNASLNARLAKSQDAGKRYREELKKLKGELKDTADQTDVASKRTSLLSRWWNQSTVAAQRNSSAVSQSTKVANAKSSALGRVKNMLQGVTNASYKLRLGYLASTAAGALLLKNAIDTAVRFDNLRLTLIAATGSVEEAELQMAKAASVAQKYGLEVEELTASYGKFMAASRGTRLEGEESEKVFTAVAKAARVYGLSGDQLTGTLRAIEQMVSKGSVQMEELKNQLGDRLPGALGLAARAMGVTRSELFKMVESGQVAADEFLPKFAKEIEKSAEASLDFAQKSPGAAIQRLSNSMKMLEASLAQSGLIDWLTKATNGLATFIDRFSDIERMGADALAVKIAETGSEIKELTARKNRFEMAMQKSNSPWYVQQIANINKELAELGGQYQRAVTRQKQLNGEIESSTLKSAAAIGQISGPAERHILNLADKAAFGVAKYRKELNELQAAQKTTVLSLTSAISSLEKEQVDAAERLEAARAKGDTKEVNRLTAHLEDVATLLASNRAELADIEKNYVLVSQEIQRKAEKEEIKRRREQSKKIVQEALQRAQELGKLDTLLGKDLAAEITGEASFKDVDVPELDFLEGLTSEQEFQTYIESLASKFEILGKAARESLSGEALEEAIRRQGQALAGVLGEVDLGLENIMPAENDMDIETLRQNYADFQDEVAERQERIAAGIRSLFPDPEQEALRKEALTELQHQFDAEKLERNEAMMQAEHDFLGQMLGINKEHVNTLANMDQASATSKIRSVAAVTSAVVSGFTGRSKKLMRLQATADAAMALSNAWTLASGAAKDTPGPWPVRAAAFAGALAMGLKAVANVRKAFSGAGASGGSSGGGAGGAVSSAGFTTPVSSAEAPPPETVPDRSLVVDLRNFDPDANYSGRQIERLMEAINQAQRDGRGLIEVTG